jgi:DnaJ family protein A protein 5
VKNYKESEWTKFLNIEKELEAIEANLVAEFGESDSEKELEVAENSLYCVACNKLFKTERTFSNHENSKKHKDSVDILKSSVLEEEEELAMSGDNQKIEEESYYNYTEINSSNGILSDSSIRSEDELEESESLETQSKNKNKKRNKKRLPKLCNIADGNTSDIEFQMFSGWSKKQCKKQQQMMQMQQNTPPEGSSKQNETGNEAQHNTDNTVAKKACTDFDTFGKKVKQKKTKNVSKEIRVEISKEGQVIKKEVARGIKVEGKVDDVKVNNKRAKEMRKKGRKNVGDCADNVRDINRCCVTCQSEFPSKNKLFDHLTKTGHSVFIPH